MDEVAEGKIELPPLEIGRSEIVRDRSESDSDESDNKITEIKAIEDTETNQQLLSYDPSTFPDGGLRAWTVVAAAFLLVFCTFGKSLSCTEN
jgi:hypothetical protein